LLARKRAIDSKNSRLYDTKLALMSNQKALPEHLKKESQKEKPMTAKLNYIKRKTGILIDN